MHIKTLMKICTFNPKSLMKFRLKINYCAILTIGCSLLVSCGHNEHQQGGVNNHEVDGNEDCKFVSYSYCSPKLLFDDHIFGNTIIKATKNNNFLKCTVVGDNEFEFSCGRGRKEAALLKTKCNSESLPDFDGIIMPKLEYDDEDLMVLYLKGGSDNWKNYFIHFSKNKIYTAQALYIDYDKRQYVYLDSQDYKNDNVFFVIHDIMTDTRDTLKTNYYKFRQDGHPALNISDVNLKNDTLFYKVSTKNGIVNDVLRVK